MTSLETQENPRKIWVCFGNSLGYWSTLYWPKKYRDVRILLFPDKIPKKKDFLRKFFQDKEKLYDEMG